MKIDSNAIQKGLRCLREYGIRELMLRVTEHLKADKTSYDEWYRKHSLQEEEWQRQRATCDSWSERPLVSICVPLYRTPRRYLCEMIDSVQAQTYTNWQLCLADGTEDGSVEDVIREQYGNETRICYEHLRENLGIAENTNAAFALASGAWIALLDHDDVLAPDALYEMLAAVKAGKADVVYSDEDKVTEDLTVHFKPHFKPDYNPDLLCSNNYITHFFMVKREIVERVGGFRREYDGSQDYDFIFRCTDTAGRIVHVPKILYHWRVSDNSTAANPQSKLYAYEAGRRAVEEHLRAKGIRAEVSHTRGPGFYRVKYQPGEYPRISIILSGADDEKALKKCAMYIEKSGYGNYEILRLEEGEESQARRANRSVALAKGEYLLFLDCHVTKMSDGWLEELVGPCVREDVAAVGCKLLNRDKTIFHAGIVIDADRIVNYAFAGIRGDRYGYMHRARSQMNYSAVSGVCMLVKRLAFEQVGGWNEKLSGDIGATDLCLRLGQAGYRVVYTPYAVAYYDGEKAKDGGAAAEEIAYMREHWAKVLERGDTCYNPNLSVQKTNYSLKSEQ